MKKSIPLFLAIILSISLCSCASYRKVNETRKNLVKVKLGMSKEEVITIVGQPRDREIYILENGQTFEVLRYLTEYELAGPIFNSDTVPICLQKGKVIGWGQKFYIDKKRDSKLLF